MTEPGDAAAATLDGHQLAALDALGTRRSVAVGEYLYREGDAAYDFFVVVSGAVEIVLHADGEERVLARHGAGRFLGELNMLTGLRVFVSARVAEAGRGDRRTGRRSSAGAGDAARAGRHDPRRLHGSPRPAAHRCFCRHPCRRVAVLARLAAHPGVPRPPSHSARVAGCRPRRGRRPIAARRRRHHRRAAGRDRVGIGAAPADARRPRRVPRSDRREPARPLLRPRRRRRRTGRARRRGVRRIRGAADAGRRRAGARRAGRCQLADRELPRLPDRHLRSRPHPASARAGREVRRAPHRTVRGDIAAGAGRAPRRSGSTTEPRSPDAP